MVAKNKKSVLIFGAAGLLGAALVDCLKNNFKVAGLSHSDCEITDKKKVDAVVGRLKPWLVINSSAYKDVDGCQEHKKLAKEVNSTGAGNIAKAAQKSRAKIIFISTDYVFDGQSSRPYKETDRVNPINHYGATKLKGEEWTARTVKEHLIIRTAWLFGAGRGNFVHDVLKRIKTESNLPIIDDKFSTPTYAVDLASAICRLCGLMLNGNWRPDYYGVYHITNSGHCSWYEYAQAILEYAHIKDFNLLPIKMKEAEFSAKRPVFSVLDNTKFTRFSGYKLRPWQEALKEYIQINPLGPEFHSANGGVDEWRMGTSPHDGQTKVTHG